MRQVEIDELPEETQRRWDLGQLDVAHVEMRQPQRVAFVGDAYEQRTAGVVVRQVERIAGDAQTSDRPWERETAKFVVGDIENFQRRKLVEVTRQRCQLIAGQQEALNHAEASEVDLLLTRFDGVDDRFELIACGVDVRRRLLGAEGVGQLGDGVVGE